MKVRTLIRLLERDGWRLVTIKGSHRHYRHHSKPGRLTVPGTMGHELPVGTLKSIQRKAGWRKRP